MSTDQKTASQFPDPIVLPGTGDLLIEPDEILAKKCGDKCGLKNCSDIIPNCPDVVVCRPRHNCSEVTIPGGCYPKYFCETQTCTGNTIKAPTTVEARGEEAAQVRQQLA